MPLQPLEVHEEPRFDAETVRQATALAERLQEERQKERREKLSLAEIDALAAELGIDPVCMRQALDAVTQTSGSKGTNAGRKRRLRRGLACAAAAAALVGGAALVLAPSGHTAAVTPAPAAFAAIPARTGKPLIPDGSFENLPAGLQAKPVKAGSRLAPGWKVTRGEVQWVTNAGSAGRYSLLLGPKAVLRADTFPTKPGSTYRIYFDMAGKPGPEPAVRRLQVVGLSAYWPQSCFTPAAGQGGLRWTTQSLDYTAPEVGTSMGWANICGAPVYLDNIRIVEVINDREVPAVDP